MTVTLKDVAASAGVSIKTVSNVIHNYPYVSKETRERVQRSVAELNYRPNLSARSLRTGRRELIALSLPDIGAPYFAEMASLIVDTAERRGWAVLIDKTSGEHGHEQRSTAGAWTDMIDGSIVSPLSMTSLEIARVTAKRPDHPVVLLGERVAGTAADHVGLDNVAAAREATEHLISLGRRRIAAIGVQPGTHGTGSLRLKGFREALTNAGLPVHRSLLGLGGSFFHRDDGYRAMQEFLANRRLPDAVFCFNDLMAQGCMRAAAEAGLRIPEDLAVVGFDDIEECRYGSPTLTSVAPDKAAIAEAAVDLLIRRISGDRAAPRQDILVAYRLQVRESTVGRLDSEQAASNSFADASDTSGKKHRGRTA